MWFGESGSNFPGGGSIQRVEVIQRTAEKELVYLRKIIKGDISEISTIVDGASGIKLSTNTYIQSIYIR